MASLNGFGTPGVWVPKVSFSLDMKLSPLGTMAASNADMSSATLYEHYLGSPLSENVPANTRGHHPGRTSRALK